MPKHVYHLQLKGFVGGEDFNRREVDAALADYPEACDVLIDSLGGSLATGLSISASFKNHGNVNVHFVGLNASAATIASLGAKHISIDAGAAYLVHKCSFDFFKWTSMNADDFDKMIKEAQKAKNDLDKLDQMVAKLYASRCKRTPAELLELMKVGGWLTADEALEWGFVDEITDYEDDASAELTDSVALAMAAAGMPLPSLEIKRTRQGSRIGKLLSYLASRLNPGTNQPTYMDKNYISLCALLGVSSLVLSDQCASLTDEQLEKIDAALDEKQRLIEAHEATIAELKAKLEDKPAADTAHIVDTAKHTPATPKNDYDEFCAIGRDAAALFALLP